MTRRDDERPREHISEGLGKCWCADEIVGETNLRRHDEVEMQVTATLVVDIGLTGERGAIHTQVAMESAIAAAIEPFMRIQSGVQHWWTSPNHSWKAVAPDDSV